MRCFSKFSLFYLTMIVSAFGLNADNTPKVPTNNNTNANKTPLIKTDEQQIQEIQEWIKQKNQQVTVKALGGNLSISGEVRTELQATSEVVNGVKQRGIGGAYPALPSRGYDVEVNLLLNYRAEGTWAAVKLEFDNNMGSQTGTDDHIALERAFFGVRLVDGDTYTMDFEFGRRVLNFTFDSQIQFGSFMDGLLYKYDQSFEKAGDFYIHAGPFVVNDSIDQYAYVGEVGLLNIANTGLYTKYSFIDWDTKDFHSILLQRKFRFINSQVILGYKVTPAFLKKVLTLYAAGLVNSAAQGLKLTHFQKENLAWYAGFSIGEVRRRGDWSFNINYQYVEAQAVPDFDSTGIGRGNAARGTLYTTRSGAGTNAMTAAGNGGNYKGISLGFLYLFTDNLNLTQSWVQSIPQNKSMGPDFKYKQYEIELIYLF